LHFLGRESALVTKVPTTDPAKIVAVHTRLVERLRAAPDIAAALAGEPANIGIHLTDPAIRLRLKLDGPNSSLLEAPEGDGEKDDVVITMKWETAHGFWSGDVDLVSSLLTGKIKVQGDNMDPLFRLKAIVNQAKIAYNQLCKEYGWT
jgi:hypothetical protein